MRSSPFTSQPVTLLVGGPDSPSKETTPVPFYVHKSLLVAISPFFRAAFESKNGIGYTEGASGIMPLPEDRPQDWAYALQWMYEEMSNSVTHSSHVVSRLYHPLVDRPFEQYLAYGQARRDYKDRHETKFVARSEPGQTRVEFKEEKPNPDMKPPTRPSPPSFGPLIRLYILADKYDLPRSLKKDICRRVDQVGRVARCVPATWDVENLWENVPQQPTWGDDSPIGTDLKETIVNMYSDLDKRSFQNLFFQADSKGATGNTAPATSPDGSENTANPTEVQPAADGEAKTCSDDDVCTSWHPVFMRDLMAKMHRQLNDLKAGVPDARKDFGGREMVGPRSERMRATGRERFPSLYANSTFADGYGVTNRPGEEVAGGGDSAS
jgi:hypothetical protein